MPILYVLKILMLFNKSLYRRIKKTHQNVISALNLSINPLFFFQKNNILKVSDKTMINNTIFINKALNNKLPPIFKNRFQSCYNIHHYSTTSSVKDHLHKKSFRVNNVGKFSVTISAIDSWNKMQDQMGKQVSFISPSNQIHEKNFRKKN